MIVLVTWKDAWSNATGHYDPTYDYEALLMEDVGYLVLENDEGILLAHTLQNNKSYRGETFLPWEMVVKVEEIVL